MNRSARRLCATVAIASLTALPVASSATATSPPERDSNQDRVNTAIEAFSGVLHDAHLRPDDEDEPIVADTTVDFEQVSIESDIVPGECFGLSALDGQPSSSEFDPDEYFSARSVAFSSGERAPEWTAAAVVTTNSDTGFELVVDAILPETETCIEDATMSMMEETSAESEEVVEDASVDVTLEAELGVGTSSMLMTVHLGAIVDGEAMSGFVTVAYASVSDGYVGISVQLEDGPWEPDEDLIREALEAMVDALG